MREPSTPGGVVYDDPPTPAEIRAERELDHTPANELHTLPPSLGEDAAVPARVVVNAPGRLSEPAPTGPAAPSCRRCRDVGEVSLAPTPALQSWFRYVPCPDCTPNVSEPDAVASASGSDQTA